MQEFAIIIMLYCTILTVNTTTMHHKIDIMLSILS